MSICYRLGRWSSVQKMSFGSAGSLCGTEDEARISPFFSKSPLLLCFSNYFGPGITAKWGVVALKPMLLVISALLPGFSPISIR